MALTKKEQHPEKINEDIWAHSDETEDLKLLRVSPPLSNKNELPSHETIVLKKMLILRSDSPCHCF